MNDKRKARYLPGNFLLNFLILTKKFYLNRKIKTYPEYTWIIHYSCIFLSYLFWFFIRYISLSSFDWHIEFNLTSLPLTPRMAKETYIRGDGIYHKKLFYWNHSGTWIFDMDILKKKKKSSFTLATYHPREFFFIFGPTRTVCKVRKRPNEKSLGTNKRFNGWLFY